LVYSDGGRLHPAASAQLFGSHPLAYAHPSPEPQPVAVRREA
jgi:hypothetical protein